MKLKRIHIKAETTAILAAWYSNHPSKTSSCLGRYRKPNTVLSVYPPDGWEMVIDDEFISYLGENDHILVEWDSSSLTAITIFECRSEVRRFMQNKCLEFEDINAKNKASLKGGLKCAQISLKTSMVI